MQEISIPLSKKKNYLLLLAALLFIVFGVLFIYRPEKFISSLYQSVSTIRLVGLLSIVFFGACFVYGVFKLFDKKPGLIINQDGITENSNASSIGLIRWADILSIETQQVMSTKFLLIFVTEPGEYLDRATGLKRKLLQANMRMYGTPLSITSNSLKCDFTDLERTVADSLTEFKKDIH